MAEQIRKNYCQAYKADGRPCAAPIKPDSSFCGRHKPSAKNPCMGVTANGSPCSKSAQPDSDMCRAHEKLVYLCVYTGSAGKRCTTRIAKDKRFCSLHDPDRCKKRYKNGTRCMKTKDNGSNFCKKHSPELEILEEERYKQVVQKRSPRTKPAESESGYTKGEMAKAMQVLNAQIVLRDKVERMKMDITEARAIDNPYEEILILAGQVVAWKDLLIRMMAELDQAELRYPGVTAEQIHGTVTVFQKALEECRTTLGLIIKLNIEERAVRVKETQAVFVADSVLKVLRKLGLDEGQQEYARSELGKLLRAGGRPAGPPAPSGTGRMGSEQAGRRALVEATRDYGIGSG